VILKNKACTELLKGPPPKKKTLNTYSMSSSKVSVNVDGMIGLEQSLIKVPIEQLKRAFKQSQKHLEKDLVAITAAAEGLGSKDTPEDILKTIENMTNRLVSLKRKVHNITYLVNIPSVLKPDFLSYLYYVKYDS
jgi:hypothetical protein